LKLNDTIIFFSLTISYFFFILFFGLWPFNFYPDNNVNWLKNTSGLKFDKHGIVHASAQLTFKERLPYFGKNGEISIEFWLKPESNVPSNSAYILCVFDDLQPEIFSLSQVKSSLNISVPDPLNSTPNWRWLQDIFIKGQQIWIAITSDKNETIVYIDGKIAIQYPNYSLAPTKRTGSQWHSVIGNNPFGQRPFIGEIYGLAIYDHSLLPERVFKHYQKWKNQGAISLSKEKDIIALHPMNEQSGNFVHNVLDDSYHFFIAERFNSPQKHFLAVPRNIFQLDYIEVRDIMINSFGFIPFGFLFFRAILSKRRSNGRLWQLVLIVVLVSTVLSLAVEGLQTFVPTRYSSLRDFILNISGTGIGALFAAVVVKKNIRYAA
jgi:hypothetical protein